jgi:hypothetical protein
LYIVIIVTDITSVNVVITMMIAVNVYLWCTHMRCQALMQISARIATDSMADGCAQHAGDDSSCSCHQSYQMTQQLFTLTHL